jgi:hypothetical protein
MGQSPVVDIDLFHALLIPEDPKQWQRPLRGARFDQASFQQLRIPRTFEKPIGAGKPDTH